MRVLVVEDDPLIREMVVEGLEEEGFEVLQAADGKEALSWCKRREADVLVTDVVLPGGTDGWQIAERCREHHPELLVIYATGFSPVDDRPVAGSLSCVSRIFRGKSSPRSGRCRKAASPLARDARFQNQSRRPTQIPKTNTAKSDDSGAAEAARRRRLATLKRVSSESAALLVSISPSHRDPPSDPRFPLQHCQREDVFHAMVLMMSASSATSVEEYATAVGRPLHALNRAHELVRPGLSEAEMIASHTSARLREVLPHEPGSIDLSRGDHGGRPILHKLATNAVKYGLLDIRRKAPGLMGCFCSARPRVEGATRFRALRAIQDWSSGAH